MSDRQYGMIAPSSGSRPAARRVWSAIDQNVSPGLTVYVAGAATGFGASAGGVITSVITGGSLASEPIICMTGAGGLGSPRSLRCRRKRARDRDRDDRRGASSGRSVGSARPSTMRERTAARVVWA